MKSDIHPESFDVTVVCACGHEVRTRSTKRDIRTTFCSNCHPFYTKKDKFIATGQVAKFKKKYGLDS